MYRKWLESKVSKKKIPALERAYAELEMFCRTKKLIDRPLLEVKKFETIRMVKELAESNKVVAVYKAKDKNAAVMAMELYMEYALEFYKKENEKKKKVVTVKTVDLKNVKQYSNGFEHEKRKPLRFVFKGKEYKGFSTWRGLYVSFVDALLDDYEPYIRSLRNRSIQGEDLDKVMGKVDVSEDRERLKKPVRLRNGLYLETDLNSGAVIRRVKYLMSICGIEEKEVRIEYGE